MVRALIVLTGGLVIAGQVGCHDGEDSDSFWDGGEEICEQGGRSDYFDFPGEFWMCDLGGSTGGEVNMTGYEGTTSLVNGAAARFDLMWDGPDMTGKTLIAGVPGDGFYRLEIDESVQPQPLEIEILQSVGSGFDLHVGVADSFDPAGHPVTGDYVVIPIRITAVMTGDVQVNVHWDTPNDVDLHVVDPTGEEIFYANPTSNSGGELDLDSNAACYIDGVNNENVHWPDGQAPHGEYTVRVDLWAACDGQPVEYRVTVVLGGTDVSTYDGSFTPADADMGGWGAGELVTTFTWEG